MDAERLLSKCEGGLHGLVEARAREMPDAISVVCGDRSITYDELDQWSTAAAGALTKAGLSAGAPVGLYADPSIEMVVGMVAILEAGGHYLPLNPGLPPPRLRFLADAAGVRFVVTGSGSWPDDDRTLVDLHRLPPASSDRSPFPKSSPHDLAYLLYTSGSTGTPKGVVVEHDNVLALLRGFEAVAPARSPLVGTCLCPFSFDVSVWEIFSVLCVGGTLHVLPAGLAADADALADHLLAHRVTSAYLPPAVLDRVASRLAQSQTPFALDRMLVGVEPIAQRTLQRFRDLSPDLRIVNGYGPTETTICATFFPFQTATEPERRTPIGYPVAGYEVAVVDEALRPVEHGEVGEILVGGAGVTRGYVNDPAATAARFIPDPVFARDDGVVYRTGDLARVLGDGALEYVGRTDGQIKIRGYRVELAEVEAALRSHPAVRNAVAVPADGPGGRRLLAFVETGDGISGTELRRSLADTLPDYMVPSRVTAIDHLPVNLNGKIDRDALLELDKQGAPLDGAGLAPRTPLEHDIAQLWQEMLGVERVGVLDDFFDLGGDSLAAATIVATMEDEMACEVTLADLFRVRTVAGLAEVATASPTSSVTIPGPP